MPEAVSAEAVAVALNTAWTLLAAFLVFFMQAGFALVEAGFTRAKNAANIVLKNLMDFAVASLAYWAVGFALMFGADAAGLAGTTGWFSQEAGFGHLDLSLPLLAFLMFQTVFAGTSATIVSGAMAERTKFASYLVFSAVMSMLIYPVVGHWVWGGGWLAQRGMLDFAGSTVVHSVGAWAALAGLILLGPRSGRFGPDGRPRKIRGHSVTLAALGVFILWFGWFGFNPGSTLAATDANIARIAVTTNLGAAAGALAALLAAWLKQGKPDVEAALNGSLGGLVAITAGTAWVSPASSILIGGVGGLAVLAGTALLERWHVDDAVGAIPVHGAAGVWGTLAVGLFHEEQGLLFGGGSQLLVAQFIGVVAVAVWTFGASYVTFRLIKATIGLRVTPQEEEHGLDLGEHDTVAYPEFVAAATTVQGPAPLPGTPVTAPAPASARGTGD